MKSIGLDIGTTTICGVVVDGENGKVLDTATLKNDSALRAKDGFSRLQDAVRIRDICGRILDSFLNRYEDIISLGVTGQMHGILYLDAEGIPVSPLYSWQDERGNQPYSGTQTYCEFLTAQTGYPMASGYGLTTHFYNQSRQLIPENASFLCTIPDYIAMYFSGAKSPVIHKSMAASLGLFHVEYGDWDRAALQKVGIGQNLLPPICEEKLKLCSSKTGLYVSPALGDNQASFLGSVDEKSNILINVGTGSQISIRTSEYRGDIDIEYRPFVGNEYLMVGAPLCGGASYALLRRFFQKTLELFGGPVPENMYEIMNRAADQARRPMNALMVDTRFNGTRRNPKCRGSIQQIGMDNFEPECLTLAVLQGIGRELYDIYSKAPEKTRLADMIIGSGNGIRQNPVLQKEIEKMFGKRLLIPVYSEEASYGAALFSLYSADKITELEDIGKMIRTE